MKYYLPKGLTYNLISPDYPAEALANLKGVIQMGISGEPDWGVDSVAGPLIRWFEYSHGNVGAGKAWALEQAGKLGPGRPSPFFEALDNALQDGATLVRGSGESTSLAYVEGNIDDEWKEPSRMLLVVLAGGDVEGCNVFFELDDLSSEVPESFPERTYLETVHTWETWGVHGESHKPIEINGKYYRTSCVGASGEPLKASYWVSYYMAGGKVLSLKEYGLLQNGNT